VGDRHRRLPRESLGQLLIEIGERAARTEDEDADRALAHAEGDAEDVRVAEPLLGGEVLGHEVGEAGELAADRLSRRHHGLLLQLGFFQERRFFLQIPSQECFLLHISAW
jgi:hypothetical protein